MKKKLEFDTLETMAANMNKHETFSGVIGFDEINFSKSTTEHNSDNNFNFFCRWRRGDKYIWFTRKYTIIMGFKLCGVFSITQLRDPVYNGWPWLSDTIVHFKKTQKKFLVSNFCVPEPLRTVKFLTQKETMVMQISAASQSPCFHSGKSHVKKRLWLE